MGEPFFDAGAWWHRQPDGSLLRWNEPANQWLLPGPDVLGPTAREAWAPIGTFATLVRVLLYVLAGVSALAAVSTGFEYELVSRIEDGAAVSEREVTFNDTRQLVIFLFALGLNLATIVVFLMWFSRSYRNLERLGASNLRYGAGWSIGAWFIPVYNLWGPKKIANDIWRASDPDLATQAGDRWRDGPVPSLLFGSWWGLWLLSNFGNATFDDPKTGAAVALAGFVITVPAALLCAAVVARMTSRQEKRAARVAASALKLPGSGPIPGP